MINKTDQVHDENTVTGWELFGQAIRKGSFKSHLHSKTIWTGKWQLFNIIKDPGEINDLSESSSEYQTILNELLDHWAVYAAETGLIR